MSRKILVIEDSGVERAFLSELLGKDYTLLEAISGEEGLSVLHRNYKSISAVLLDIILPGMDGFEVLKQIKASALMQQIPVIVITGIEDEAARTKALTSGANTYVTKPIDKVLFPHILRNTISLCETSAIVNALRRDRLTGLYNRDTFFSEAARMIARHEPGHYILSCYDVDSFKVVNDQYGTDMGDRVLKHIADCIDSCISLLDGICCHSTGDVFALLYPAKYKDSKLVLDAHQKTLSPTCISRTIRMRIGRYHINDHSLPVSAMYDRAMLAAKSIKGRYDVYIADYHESMRDDLLREQEIVNQMHEALATGQFEAWLQPQYNHATGALVGSEALVRWRDPKGGRLIPPIEFIPAFERNGFIYELDKYIWRQVCVLLRKWLDEGRDPLPVSVNISRHDVFYKDFVSFITGLVHEYDIPIRLLRLEITESAFAEAAKSITHAVNELIECGFTVEIDDFGSGYSSLNTLKDVPAQILKLDMKFFANTENSRRSGNIIESVVRMAKWLGMTVIAEGVEEMAQADYLKSIGCYLIQGYLYAKPMPAADYEKLMEQSEKEPELTKLKTLSTYDNSAFWDPKSMETLMFNSYVGGACIFEYHNGETELLRVNERYAQELGKFMPSSAQLSDIKPTEFLDKENHDKLFENIRSAIATNKESTCEVRMIDRDVPGRFEYIRLTMRVIAQAGERYLFYSVIVNTTEQHVAEQKRFEAEKKETESAQQLQVIMRNINGGVSAILIDDDNGTSKMVFCNERYFELYGYTREQALAEKLDVLSLVVPEDLPELLEKIKQLKKERGSVVVDYRCRRRDGRITYLRANASLMSMEGIGEDVITSVVTDITEQRQLADRLTTVVNNINGGVTATVIRDGKPEFIIVNDQFFTMLGYTREQYKAECPDKYSRIHPADRDRIIEQFESSDGGKKQYTMEYRVITRNGAIRHIRNNISVVSIFGVDEPVQLSVANDVTAEKEASERLLLLTGGNAGRKSERDERIAKWLVDEAPIVLSTMMSASDDLSFVKDRELRYVCCSHSVALALDVASEETLIGKTDYELFSNDLADKFTSDDRRVMESGKAMVNAIETIPGKDGTVHYVKTSKYPLTNSSGEVIGLYGVSRDVTEERETNFELNALLNVIPSGILKYAADKDEKFEYVSRNFIESLGYTEAQFKAKFHNCFHEMVYWEDREQEKEEILRQESDGKIGKFDYRIETFDGSLRYFHDEGVLITDQEGKSWYYVTLVDVTEQKEAEEKLRVSEEENRLAIAHSGNMITKFDVRARTLSLPESINPIFSLNSVLYNMPQEQIALGRVSPETAGAYAEMFENIIRGSKSGSATFQQDSQKGWRWLEAQYTTVFSDQGKPVSAVITFADVTERLEKEVVYNKWQQSLNDRPDDSFTLFRCNLSKNGSFDSWEGSLLNVDFSKEGQNFDQRTAEYVEQCVYKEDVGRYLAFLNSDTLLADYYRGQRSKSIEYRESGVNGEPRWLRLSVDLVEYPNSKDIEVYLLYEDIDEQKKAELLTREKSETDPLTGVLNRATFIERMERMLSESMPTEQHALFMLDIDEFKNINDTLGHSAGDQVLMDLTRQIKSILRHGDLLGRLGGDEFLVFLNSITGDAAAEKKARQICALDIKTANDTIPVYISMGIAMIPRDGSDFDSLYKKFDAALYKKKRSGKRGFVFCEQECE